MLECFFDFWSKFSNMTYRNTQRISDSPLICWHPIHHTKPNDHLFNSLYRIGRGVQSGLWSGCQLIDGMMSRMCVQFMVKCSINQ